MTLRSALAWMGRLTLAAAAVYSVLPSRVAQLLVETNVSAEIVRSRSSSGFVVSSAGWTDFAVPSEQSLIKVVSNANVPEAIYSIPDLQCEYTLRLELLDSGGKALKVERVALRASPLTYRDDVTGVVLPAQTYLGVPSLPLSSRTTIVNVIGLESTARRLRVSLEPSDQRVVDVTVRVYAHENPAAYKLRYLWQRMSIDKRERLARASVHGLDFLTDKEKENLLENRWVAVAPLGIDGSEFFERKLYTLRERHDAVARSILPFGLFIGPGTLGTIPIPQDGGCVRLDLEPAPGPHSSPEVRVVWRQRGGVDGLETSLSLGDGAIAHRFELDGGILELEASDPVVARAYLERDSTPLEITPEAKCVQAFRVHPGAPLELAIVNGSNGPGAFRLDIRRLSGDGQDDAASEPQIAYELLDDQRNVVGSGRIPHSLPDSWYDRLTGTARVVPVSDPARHYFSLPKQCAVFRISSSSESLCVTTYTRPNELERKLRIPEDYLLFERAQEDTRTWFPLRPQSSADSTSRENEVFVRTQARPPDPVASDEPAASVTSSCSPEGPVDALKLLTPVSRRRPQPIESLAPYFVRLDPGHVREVYLGDENGGPVAMPRLISIRQSDAAVTLSLLDGRRAYHQFSQASLSNEESLPPLDEGWHELRLESPPGGSVYVNSLLVETEDLHLERHVHRLGTGGLKYRVRKSSPGRETLALRLYTPSTGRADAIVRVTFVPVLNGAERTEGSPADSWTYPDTVYHVRAAIEGAIPVVGADEGPFSEGEVFLWHLGADLSPGWCEVLVQLEAGPPCWLSVLHSAPGSGEKRQLSSERNFGSGDTEP